MRRTLLILVALAACERSQQAHDDGRFPLPAGFARVQDKDLGSMPPGSYAYTEISRMQPDAFLGSIVVAALGDQRIAINPEFCDATGQGFSRQSGVIVESSLVVTLPRGPACQIQGRAPDKDTIRVEYTVLHPAKGPTWGVTCNYDSRDDAALRACKALLDNR